MTDHRPADAPRRPAGRRTGRGAVLLRIGHFYGVPLYFAPSWVLIATVITILYSAIVRTLVSGISTGASYAAALGFAIALALCVLAHELGHTAVSLALGRPVRRVVIFLLGGVSEIDGDIDSPRDELLIAAAGPLVSAVLAAVAAACALFTRDRSLAAVMLGLLAWSNIIVAGFNLLPGLPLDGGRILRAAVWGVTRSPRTGTQVAAWGGRVIAVGIGVGSAFLVRQSWGVGSWLASAALAGFIWDGANRSLRAARFRDRVKTVRVADLLRPGVAVPADISLAEALRRARASSARGIVVIDGADRPQAIVEESRVGDVPIERQPWTSVTDVARALEPGLVLADDLAADALIAAVRRTPADEYLVVRADGALAGILSASDLAAALGDGRR